MSLFLTYKDPETQENKELFIKVCLSSDYSSENTITEHPSETRKSFTDNSIENLREVPAIIFIPAEEEVELIIRKEDITTFLKNGAIVNAIPIDSNGMQVSSTTTGIQKRKKEDVLALLEKIKAKAVVIDYLDINSRVYSGFMLKSISFQENIDSGDGWDVSLTFKETPKVNSQKTTLSKEIIAKLKAALAASLAKNDGSNASILAKIANANKTAGAKDKGNQKGVVNNPIENFRNSFATNPDTYFVSVPGMDGKYAWMPTVSDSKRNQIIEIGRREFNLDIQKYMIN